MSHEHICAVYDANDHQSQVYGLQAEECPGPVSDLVFWLYRYKLTLLASLSEYMRMNEAFVLSTATIVALATNNQIEEDNKWSKQARFVSVRNYCYNVPFDRW